MLHKDSTTPFKTWHLILVGVIIITTLALRIYYSGWPERTVTVAGLELRVLVADTEKRRIEGWSNKKSMGEYDGMLFVFYERKPATMVMRDMRFPLDIVWIDGGTIVDMAPEVMPEPGRTEAELTPYMPRMPATAVLELPAGFIREHKLKIGDTVEIEAGA